MMQDKEIFYSRNGATTALKISNFHLNFNPIQHPFPTQLSDPLTQRKKSTHSSYSQTRRPQETSPIKLRTLHTSQLNRHSPIPAEESVQMRTMDRYQEQLPPEVGHNIKELKQLMREKVAAIKEIAAQQNSFHFKEYQITAVERQRWNRSTLHSRKIAESPFLKAIKPKKIASSGAEAQHSLIIPAQKSRKEEGKRKMILIGGSIPVRAVSSNPEDEATYSPLKSARRQLGIGHASSIRRTHQNKQHGVVERYQNDCRPWDFHKGEGMEESSNIYHYQK